MDALSVSFFLGYILLVWFNTNAFVEYLNLFRFSKFFYIAEYNKLRDGGYGELYVDFLREYYKDFFAVRLITCPICLSFWLGLIPSYFFGFPEAFMFCPLALFFYLVFNRML